MTDALDIIVRECKGLYFKAPLNSGYFSVPEEVVEIRGREENQLRIRIYSPTADILETKLISTAVFPFHYRQLLRKDECQPFQDSSFSEHLHESRERVASWPAWKREVIGV